MKYQKKHHRCFRHLEIHFIVIFTIDFPEDLLQSLDLAATLCWGIWGPLPVANAPKHHLIWFINPTANFRNSMWASSKLPPKGQSPHMFILRRCMPCNWGHDSLGINGVTICSPIKVYQESCSTIELDENGMFFSMQVDKVCANTPKWSLKCIRQWKWALPQVEEFQI